MAFKIKHLIVLFFSTFLCISQNIDINILRDINLNRDKSTDNTFKFITNTSAAFSILAPVLIYSTGLIKHDSILKKQALFIGKTFLINTAITTALKYAVSRERPFNTYPDLDKQSKGGGGSMPSGHTSTAFATATSLSIAFPKWYVIAPSFVWASTVGYSRMHLGVHYPSDVLVGALVGSGSAYLTYKFNKWISKKYNSKNEL